MGKIINGKFPTKLPKIGKSVKKKTPESTYQLKISLLYLEPLIWRRVQVPNSINLSTLHDVIQLCMGWADSHLHQFTIGNNFYRPPEEEENDWNTTKFFDETKFTLKDLTMEIQKQCMYEYDFGDSWQHAIELEKIIVPDKKTPKYPVLLAGARACPPEDIGGIPGYENFLAAFNDSDNEDYKEIRDWYGSNNFDPDFFRRGAINKILKKIK